MDFEIFSVNIESTETGTKFQYIVPGFGPEGSVEAQRDAVDRAVAIFRAELGFNAYSVPRSEIVCFGKGGLMASW